MNKTASRCRQWATILSRSIGNEQVATVLTEAAGEIERLERDAAHRTEAATPATSGKSKRQG